jgi:hypothetical protein
MKKVFRFDRATFYACELSAANAKDVIDIDLSISPEATTRNFSLSVHSFYVASAEFE